MIKRVFRELGRPCRLQRDCRPEPGSTSNYRIEFRPETAFLWGTVETYRLLGLPVDDDAVKILSEQARLQGVEP